MFVKIKQLKGRPGIPEDLPITQAIEDSGGTVVSIEEGKDGKIRYKKVTYTGDVVHSTFVVALRKYANERGE